MAWVLRVRALPVPECPREDIRSGAARRTAGESRRQGAVPCGTQHGCRNTQRGRDSDVDRRRVAHCLVGVLRDEVDGVVGVDGVGVARVLTARALAVTEGPLVAEGSGASACVSGEGDRQRRRTGGDASRVGDHERRGCG